MRLARIADGIRAASSLLIEITRAIVCLNAKRQHAALGRNARHYLHDVLTCQRLPRFNGKALSGEVVQDGQGAKPLAVEQRIRDEVHAPALIGCGQLGALQAVGSGFTTIWSFAAQIQSFFLV